MKPRRFFNDPSMIVWSIVFLTWVVITAALILMP